jgi:DNA (cytosine-5)-methyltransferase 1
MRCVELFTGCGGLAIGLCRAGFKPERMSEWDRQSVLNINHNRELRVDLVRDWPIHQEDVRHVDWSQFLGIDLVAGGPPCQPFSIGGLHRGHADERDMWPEAVRVIREAKPSAFIFENVRGLARTAFADYLHWVVLSLSLPHLKWRESEDRRAHLKRLETSKGEATYRVSVQQVNAADFGVAQKRHRVFILGVRNELERSPPTLRPTNSRDRLLWDQWITGEYWARHRVRRPIDGPEPLDLGVVRRLKQGGVAPAELSWRTVRDAVNGLAEPVRTAFPNHVLQPGARAYPGHTGSALDMPAKALKAGVHGVPGGENMMALPDGSVRYFTVREAARLQGMPDDFEFVGAWSENMRQLGNAVPVQLAEHVGTKMRETIEAARGSKRRRAA